MKSLDDLRDFNIPDEVVEFRINEVKKNLKSNLMPNNPQTTTVIVALNDGVVLKIDSVKHWYYESKSEMFFIHYEGNKNFIIAKKEIKYIGDDENLRRFETE